MHLLGGSALAAAVALALCAGGAPLWADTPGGDASPAATPPVAVASAPASPTVAPAAADSSVPAASTDAAPTDSTPPATAPPSDITRTVLPDGLRIIVKQEPDTPLTAIDVFVKVGSEQERDNEAGIGNFVAETLFASTGSRMPDTIQSEIADLGGNVQATCQPDWTEISGLTIPEKYEDAVSLITDVIKDATFDDDVVTAKRDDILTEIDSGNASVFDQTYNNMRSQLFSDSGYGLPQLGTSRTLNHIGPTQLKRYYMEYFIPKNMVFVVVGRIDPQAAIDTIESDMSTYDPFARGSARQPPVQEPQPILTSDLPPVHAYQPDLSEVCVMAGFRAPAMSSPDYPALDILNALVGGMKTSRMFTNLREKQGLAYELGSFYSPQLYSGDITGYIFSAPDRIDPVTKQTITVDTLRDQLLAQFASMQTTPPTAEELARAKHYLIGSDKIKHERVEDRASLLGIAELTSSEGAQADEDYAAMINAVTIDDVVRVAKTYLVHPVISTLEPAPQDGSDTVNE